jgi:hypothetical protein
VCVFLYNFSVSGVKKLLSMVKILKSTESEEMPNLHIFFKYKVKELFVCLKNSNIVSIEEGFVDKVRTVNKVILLLSKCRSTGR